MQVPKKRAESLNNTRVGTYDNRESRNYSIDFTKPETGNASQEEMVEYEYIQSNNMKYSTKGSHKEVRAPSQGSTSQPRVQISGKHSDSGSHAGRRYDSVEHQR